MTRALDLQLMDRALREAKKGRPSPNPHVGAVVARGSEIIAVGHHQRCGGPHAEAAALARAGRRARGATLYVTFEPCNHYGRTGPCTEAILAARVGRVVIGCADPTPHAAGSTAKLRAAGVKVDFGLRQEQAEALVEDFAKLARTGMPFVTLKAAVTLDGKLATASGDSRWVSSEAARREAHRLRAESDAVLVGAGTALADDPELNVRLVRGRNPLRVVLDTKLRLPLDSKLVQVRPELRTLIFHGPKSSTKKRAALLARGVELVELPLDARGRLRLRAVLRELGRRDVMRLLVEGGGCVHGAFLDAGLADRAVVAVAPRILGDAAGISLANGRKKRRMREAIALEAVRVRRLGPDVLFEGRIARKRVDIDTAADLR